MPMMRSPASASATIARYRRSKMCSGMKTFGKRTALGSGKMGMVGGSIGSARREMSHQVAQQPTALLVCERCAPACHFVNLSRPAGLIQALLGDQIAVVTRKTLLTDERYVGVSRQFHVRRSGPVYLRCRHANTDRQAVGCVPQITGRIPWW